MRIERAVALAVVLGSVAASGVGGQEVLSTRAMLSTPPVEADVRIAYGAHPLQYGDLYLPEGPGPHPVAVVVHGGCWLALADLGYMSHVSRRLAERGWAVWSLEFRRIDQEGGAWPGILADVARGTDHVRALAADYPLDVDRVVTLGHSSGGHLALWLAARERLPAGRHDPRPGRPLEVGGVVGLAAIADLEEFGPRRDRSCGDGIVEALLGVEAEERHEALRSDRLRLTSPAEMLPLGVPQLLVNGALDGIVPLGHAERYGRRAREAGDAVEVVPVPGAGHFEIVAPWTEGWEAVERRILDFMNEVTGAGVPDVR